MGVNAIDLFQILGWESMDLDGTLSLPGHHPQ